jgi:hypothetical protein
MNEQGSRKADERPNSLSQSHLNLNRANSQPRDARNWSIPFRLASFYILLISPTSGTYRELHRFK